MVNLFLCDRLTQTDPPNVLGNITRLARDWRRTIRSWGGYWLGSFELTEQDVGGEGLLQWYNNYLGHHVKETTFGQMSWEGIIYEMTLTWGERTTRRTLDREWTRNRVKILYEDGGTPANTGWDTDADSVAWFGQVDHIESIGEATAAEAAGRQAMVLKNYGWPIGRAGGGLSFGVERRQRPEKGLHIVVAGYVFTLNWRLRESSLTNVTASSAITTLVGDSEFVTAGTIDDNFLAVDVDCTTAQCLWDALLKVIQRGDDVGNLWVGGVYAGRKFHYQLAAVDTLKYYAKGDVLTDRGRVRVVPSMVEANCVVRDVEAPTE